MVLALKKQEVNVQNGSITFNETKNSLYRIIAGLPKNMSPFREAKRS